MAQTMRLVDWLSCSSNLKRPSRRWRNERADNAARVEHLFAQRTLEVRGSGLKEDRGNPPVAQTARTHGSMR
jgi:hypothetical protein